MLLKNKKLNVALLSLFAITEVVFAYIILIRKINVSINCFLSIAVAFLCSIFFLDIKNKTALLNLGLFFTLIADTFLVLFNPPKQILGVIFFIFVQTCYFLFIYFSNENKKINKFHLIFRIVAIIIALTILFIVLKGKVDFLSVISLFYIANLFTNIVFAYCDKKLLLLAIGLTFFILCDIFVGLSVAVDSYIFISETSIIYKLLHLNIDLIWTFYIPSQTIIVLFLGITKTFKKK